MHHKIKEYKNVVHRYEYYPPEWRMQSGDQVTADGDKTNGSGAMYIRKGE
jgi:hypothetical protein